MEIGLKYTAQTTVDHSNTALAIGSGDLHVFATPAMIALMENVAAQAVKGVIEDGSTTVGTVVNIVHARASGIGETVTAMAELREIEGRKLIFHVVATDSHGVIGEGVHERVIIDIQRFMSKI